MDKINRILFMGCKELGLRIFKEMYCLSPEKLIGAITINDSNDTRSQLENIKIFAQESALELFIAHNQKETDRIIQILKPELCLVAGWYWLINPVMLETVPYGFIGIHYSLLPKFRGGSPLVWTLINREEVAGASFFSFTPGMDEGPIWAQVEVTVGKEDYIADILHRLEEETIKKLRIIYPQIIEQKIVPKKQNHNLATYCAQRLPKDGVIKWNEPAELIHAFIRAQSDPYPGSFTYFEGRVLKVWRARLFNKPYFGTAGQIARIYNGDVWVVCGDQRAIIVEEVELDGVRGKAGDFIKSINVRLPS